MMRFDEGKQSPAFCCVFVGVCFCVCVLSQYEGCDQTMPWSVCACACVHLCVCASLSDMQPNNCTEILYFILIQSCIFRYATQQWYGDIAR